MKKVLSLIAAVLLLIPFAAIPKASAVNFPYNGDLNSESLVLISLDTNEIISEKNADLTQCPGPLVNIMTAVVVLENCKDLNKEVTMDPDIYTHVYEELDDNEDLPQLELSDYDVLSVKDLLYCMMLTSSIEASECLADHVGKLLVADGAQGTPTGVFIDKMNEKAAQIGMTSTKFTNAHGMYDKEQYTTARDMAKLTQYALEVPLFRQISTTYSYNPVVPNITRHPNHDTWIWTHSNVMMDETDIEYHYLGAKGIKTAKLEKAGRNIVTIAGKNGYNYLVVLMKAPFKDEEGNSRFCHIDDAKNVFDWAFNHFSKQVLLASTAEMGEREVKLADSGDKSYITAIPKESVEMLWCDEVDIKAIDQNLDKINWYKDTFQAPIKAGDPLGEATLTYSGEKLATVELVAKNDVKRSTFKYNVEVAKQFHKSEWFSTAIKISIVLCVIYILICVYAFVLFKSSKKPLKPIYAVPKVGKKKKKKKPENHIDDTSDK